MHTKATVITPISQSPKIDEESQFRSLQSSNDENSKPKTNSDTNLKKTFKKDFSIKHLLNSDKIHAETNKNNNNNDNNVDIKDSYSEYLSIVEPYPMEPPLYSTTLPWTSHPSFDTFEPKNEKLPIYTPTVYKLGILYRKMEWISPYEMASQRHWKPYIVELNSTQINFYGCQFKPGDPILKKFDVSSSFSSSNSHSLLHPYHHHHLYLKKISGEKAPSAIDPGIIYNYNEDNYRSVMTNKVDLKALKYFKSINALESTKIVRSYSLQYGKVGLAIDYKKKNYVFRCRFETEQFLLEFPSSESMIEWYNAIDLGIDNSSDLSRREIPSYRTIPRRRRRRRKKKSNVGTSGIHIGHLGSIGTNHFRNDESNNKKDKSVSNFNLNNSSSHENNNSRILHSKSIENFFKKSSSHTDILGVFKKNASKSNSATTTELMKNKKGNILIGNKSPSKNSDELNRLQKRLSNVQIGKQVGQGHEHENDHRTAVILNYDDYEEAEELIDDDEEEFDVEQHFGNEEISDEEDDDSDIDLSVFMNVDSNINISNGKSAENNGFSSVMLHNKISQPNGQEYYNNDNYPLRSYEEYIAKPSPYSINTHTYPAQRKILRDSIRCMVPLTENERWVGKFVLLDVCKNYKPQSKESVDYHYQSLEVLMHVSTVGNNYVHRFRRPLQEWIVTPSGLIPFINPLATRISG